MAGVNSATLLDSMTTASKWGAMLRTHGPQLAVWGLALLIAAQGASIVTHLAGAGRSTTAMPAASGAPGRNAHLDVNTITSSHLFGAAPAAAASGENVPRANVPLVLTGIIAADNPKDGLAILGESTSTARVYAVGDSVPGGVRVHEVYPDRVLIDRNGEISALVLPRQSNAATPPNVAMNVASGEAAERVRRVIEAQPSVISDVMRPQPVVMDGKQRGYRVYPGPNRAAFLRLGLRPGDLVVGINGTPLDDPARGEEIFRTLGSSSDARITVMRSGRQQDISVNLGQLASQAEQLSAPEGAPAQPPAVTAPPLGQQPADNE